VEREPIDWVPRAPRRRVSLRGLARWEDGSSAPVLVSNISYRGCQLWTDHEIEYGETVTLTLPGYGRIEAHVRWVSGGAAGLRFLTKDSAVDDRRARVGV
jgi:PilZ domain